MLIKMLYEWYRKASKGTVNPQKEVTKLMKMLYEWYRKASTASDIAFKIVV